MNARAPGDAPPSGTTEEPTVGAPAARDSDLVILDLGSDAGLAEFTSESLPLVAADNPSASATDLDGLELYVADGPKEDPSSQDDYSAPTVASALTVARPHAWRLPHPRAAQLAILAYLVLVMLAGLLWRSAVLKTGDPLPQHTRDAAAVHVAPAAVEPLAVGPLAAEQRLSSRATPAPSAAVKKTAAERRAPEARASAADVKRPKVSRALPRAAIRTPDASVGNVQRPLSAMPPPAAPLANTPVAGMNRAVPVPPADATPSETPGPATPLPVDAVTARATANPPAPSSAAVTRSRETADIQSVLTRYASAFRDLDARAVSQVWPNVDSRALARAFRGLAQQEIAFDRCNISATDASAVASCGGTVRYVTRVGNKNPRAESRQWQFSMRKVGERWLIEGVESR